MSWWVVLGALVFGAFIEWRKGRLSGSSANSEGQRRETL